jgi:hypothetical protein
VCVCVCVCVCISPRRLKFQINDFKIKNLFVGINGDLEIKAWQTWDNVRCHDVHTSLPSCATLELVSPFSFPTSSRDIHARSHEGSWICSRFVRRTNICIYSHTQWRHEQIAVRGLYLPNTSPGYFIKKKLLWHIFKILNTRSVSYKIWGFTAVTKKNVVFWDVAPCRSCVNRRLEERITSIFRVEKSASEEPAWAGGFSLLLLLQKRSHYKETKSLEDKNRSVTWNIVHI